MPLGDSTAITLCSVLPTMIFASICLKERIRIYKAICGILVISGIVLVIRPPFVFPSMILNNKYGSRFSTNVTTSTAERNYYMDSYYYFGAASALCCIVCKAVSNITVKILVQNVSSSSSELFTFYYSMGCIIVTVVAPFIGGNQRILLPYSHADPYDLSSCIGLCFIAIMGVMTAFMRVYAIILVGPVIVSFVSTTKIIASYLVQIILFHTIPGMFPIVGSICIAAACVGVLLEDMVLNYLPPRLHAIC